MFAHGAFGRVGIATAQCRQNFLVLLVGLPMVAAAGDPGRYASLLNRLYDLVEGTIRERYALDGPNV
jgi:hypothetical protein